MTSRYQKGKSLELKIASIIRSKMGIDAFRDNRSGANWWRNRDIIAPSFPFVIEAKCQERHNIWKEWEQARSQAVTTNKDPMLVISGNHRPVLAVVELDTIVNMQAEIEELWDELKELRK